MKSTLLLAGCLDPLGCLPSAWIGWSWFLQVGEGGSKLLWALPLVSSTASLWAVVLCNLTSGLFFLLPCFNFLWLQECYKARGKLSFLGLWHFPSISHSVSFPNGASEHTRKQFRKVTAEAAKLPVFLSHCCLKVENEARSKFTHWNLSVTVVRVAEGL